MKTGHPMATSHSFAPIEKRIVLTWKVLLLIPLIVMPLLFADMMASALMKLKLPASTAVVLVLAIMLGSLVNIPVKRIRRTDLVGEPAIPIPILKTIAPGWHARPDTIIAVNVGGCLVPLGIAIYEAVHLLRSFGAAVALALAAAVLLNVALCFFLAKPVPQIGIMIPRFAPALVGALSALLLMPESAPPIAFVAGVVGPLVGADLMHVRQFAHMSAGIASIGGAGTFDGIVFSGIVAAYLA